MKTTKQLIQQTYSWKISQVRMIRSRFKTTLSTEIYSPELGYIEEILDQIEKRCRENMKFRLQQEELKQTQETLKKVNAILSKEEDE